MQNAKDKNLHWSICVQGRVVFVSFSAIYENCYASLEM